MDDIESQMMQEMKAQMKKKEEQNAKLMLEMQNLRQQLLDLQKESTDKSIVIQTQKTTIDDLTDQISKLRT